MQLVVKLYVYIEGEGISHYTKVELFMLFMTYTAAGHQGPIKFAFAFRELQYTFIFKGTLLMLF